MRALECLVTIVDQGSPTQAAAVLHMSQPGRPGPLADLGRASDPARATVMTGDADPVAAYARSLDLPPGRCAALRRQQVVRHGRSAGRAGINLRDSALTRRPGNDGCFAAFDLRFRGGLPVGGGLGYSPDGCAVSVAGERA
jgi:hypothetical protein